MSAVHKIIGDLYEDPFDLVALHSSLADYQLAYFINMHLNRGFADVVMILKYRQRSIFPFSNGKMNQMPSIGHW